MLLPLPGSSGNHTEPRPTNRPAAATPGMTSHEVTGSAGRAMAIIRLNAVPTANASGASTTAKPVSR